MRYAGVALSVPPQHPKTQATLRASGLASSTMSCSYQTTHRQLFLQIKQPCRTTASARQLRMLFVGDAKPGPPGSGQWPSWHCLWEDVPGREHDEQKPIASLSRETGPDRRHAKQSNALPVFGGVITDVASEIGRRWTVLARH